MPNRDPHNILKMANYKEKLKAVTTFVLDFDGVLSDGKIYVMADGEQVRATNVKDGYALQYALRKGYRVAVISGGYAESMKLRYSGFEGMEMYLHVPDKAAKLKEYMLVHGLMPENVLAVGDDIPDCPMLRMCGVKCCPADAAVEVQQMADYVSNRPGGCGCVRDVIEQTLRLKGDWYDSMAHLW